ncbi:MAG TPA: ATP-binding protein [Dissulfurispiraceae bacterium]|nr:ATP-binding protein [Dissulfurispiraceae bacterium]
MPTSKKRSQKAVYSLLLILVIATVATVFSSVVMYRNAVDAADNALRLQAFGLAATLEASLRRMDLEKGTLFSDIITESAGEGIAFLALYGKNGNIIMHSNANLIGRPYEDERVAEVFSSGQPKHYYLMLGTEERVSVLDMPVHVGNAIFVLRLALHPYPAESGIREARIQLATAAGVVVLLWAIGFILLRALRRSEELRRRIEERERLVVLGEMAAVLAHEIRNPLGSIKGFAQYLLEQQSSASPNNRPKNMQQPLSVIVQETQRLERLTNDLLIYACPANAHSAEFDLCALIDNVIALLQPHPEISIRCECSAPLAVTSDEDKVRQILANLLQNASDAIEGPGSIAVSASMTRDTILLSVADSGPGMDPSMKERAFEPFFTTKVRGTGLGLAIVGRLVDVLGGAIDLESPAGKGTTVIIKLPRTAKQPEK